MNTLESINNIIAYIVLIASVSELIRVWRSRKLSYPELAKRHPRMKRILLRSWQRNRLK